jgi:hypothetical protein
LANGNARVTFAGPASQPYRLWASTDVARKPVATAWTLLSSATFAGTPVVFTDETAANPRRFYVISSP